MYAPGVVLREVPARHFRLCVPGFEGLVLLARLEKRRLRTVVRRLSARPHARGGLPQVKTPVRVQRRAHRDVIKAVFRADALDAEGPVKATAQHVGEGQRPAEVQNFARYRPALREPRDGLVDDRLVYAGCNILRPRALVYERLYVALGENAAAGGDGVGLLGVAGPLVELLGAELQQRGHLVDKRAGAPGAGAVHAHFHGPGEEKYLRVLAAELDYAVRARREPVRRDACREDLLHEGYAHGVRHAHAGAAGNGKLRDTIGYICRANSVEKLLALLQYMAVVPLIVAEDQPASLVQHHAFNSCRANIQPDPHKNSSVPCTCPAKE